MVSNYQQVGRAGRGVEHADVVLLRGGEDRRIQDFFIEQAFPERERVVAVLAELEAAGEEGRTTRELMAMINLGMGRIEAMLKILDVEGAVRRHGNLRARRVELEVKKVAPGATGAMRKIHDDVRTETGWALARFGDGGWWPAVERGLREGSFEHEVIVGLAVFRAPRLLSSALRVLLRGDIRLWLVLLSRSGRLRTRR